MWIKRVCLHDFRNYKLETIELNQGLNVFVGANAQGKTNFLEALYVLSLSKSYRAGRDGELIRHEAPQMTIQAEVQRLAEVDLAVCVNNRTPKKLWVNGKSTRAGSFVGKLNIVLFTPDSLQMIKGSPSRRRGFLDVQICQIDSLYHKTLARYQKVLGQRNRLLREGRERRSVLNQLPVWDSQLVELGSAIVLRRQEVLAKLNCLGRDIHGQISAGGENLNIVYRPFFASESQDLVMETDALQALFQQLIQKKGEEERGRGHTLVGPHRDDIDFFINGQDCKIYGSQGQQRTAVLSYILAEMEFMYEETGEYPVVLLDDVMSELDQKRRLFLLSVLNQKAQTIVTTTNLNSFTGEIIEDASVFEIKAGKIQKM